MKAKLDENLPLRIAIRLRDLGHDIHTTEQENLSGCGDSELWTQAQRESRTLITQDLDFSDSRRFRPGTYHGLVLVTVARSESRAVNPAIGRGFSDGGGRRVAGMLCRRDRSKNPRATEAKPILEWKRYCPARTGETINGLAVRFLASPLSF
jgi:predicted nuclease of predicted toxin-antitoxin system